VIPEVETTIAIEDANRVGNLIVADGIVDRPTDRRNEMPADRTTVLRAEVIAAHPETVDLALTETVDRHVVTEIVDRNFAMTEAPKTGTIIETTDPNRAKIEMTLDMITRTIAMKAAATAAPTVAKIRDPIAAPAEIADQVEDPTVVLTIAQNAMSRVKDATITGATGIKVAEQNANGRRGGIVAEI